MPPPSFFELRFKAAVYKKGLRGIIYIALSRIAKNNYSVFGITILRNVRGIQIALECGRGLFAGLYAMLVLCFLSSMSWRYAAWFVISVLVVILYWLSPNVLCGSSFLRRLALGVYWCTVAVFVSISSYLIFNYTALGSEPLLISPIFLHEDTEYAVGSGRIWVIAIAVFMTLCALSGPISLFLHRSGQINK